MRGLWERVIDGCRRRRRQGLERWRRTVAECLVNDVFPPGTPYQYDSAPSFLQEGPLDAADPVRVALFFPEIPLAVEIRTAAERHRYRPCEAYVSRAEWMKEQGRQARLGMRLAAYRCAHLILHDDDPVDPSSLSQRLRMMLGYSP